MSSYWPTIEDWLWALGLAAIAATVVAGVLGVSGIRAITQDDAKYVLAAVFAIAGVLGRQYAWTDVTAYYADASALLAEWDRDLAHMVKGSEVAVVVASILPEAEAQVTAVRRELKTLAILPITQLSAAIVLVMTKSGATALCALVFLGVTDSYVARCVWTARSVPSWRIGLKDLKALVDSKRLPARRANPTPAP